MLDSCTVLSAVLRGITATAIPVHAHAGGGQSGIRIDGEPCTDDVVGSLLAAAIKAAGVTLPDYGKLITLVTSPGGHKGRSLNLAMAAAALTVALDLPGASKKIAFIGGVCEEGYVSTVPGVFAMVEACRDAGARMVYVPRDNLREASLVEDIRVVGVPHLSDLLGMLRDSANINASQGFIVDPLARTNLAEIGGNERAKRALEIAAVGEHHVMLVGTAGAPSCRLGSALAGIRPALTVDERKERTRIVSASNLGDWERPDGMDAVRPFRVPHHTVSAAGLLGDYRPAWDGSARPGEVTLAHLGVMLLCGTLDFQPHALELLGDAVARGSTVANYVELPARCQVVAVEHRCPCGGAGIGSCVCPPLAVQRHHKKMGGRLRHRLELYVPVTHEPKAHHETAIRETSADVRARVTAAVDFRRHREATYGAGSVSLDDNARVVLAESAKALGLKKADEIRAIRVARSIADLAESEQVTGAHIGEALGFRFP